MKKSQIKLFMAISAISVSNSLFAGELDSIKFDDFIIRGGAAYVKSPSTKSKLHDTKFGYKSSVVGSASVVWRLEDNFGIQLSATTPAKLTTTIAKKANFADVNYQQTALTGQFYFTEMKEFQPYVGLGVAYNRFKPKLSQEFKDTYKQQNKLQDVSSKISSKNKFSIIGEVGVDYYFNSNWLVNASLSYTQIKNDTKVVTTASNIDGTITAKDSTKLKPIMMKVNVGYRF